MVKKGKGEDQFVGVALRGDEVATRIKAVD